MRVAVTGGSGRIGSVVIRHLLEAGHEVINIDRRQARQPMAPFVYADLRRREQVQPILQQVEAVCHLGEIPNSSVGLTFEEVYWSNTQAGSVVMQTAADLGLKRLIYTSTCQVYGCWDDGRIAPERLPMDETHPLRPRNVYALSKAANEGYAQFVAREYGLSVAIFRPPWVMSPDRGLNWMLRHLEEDESGPMDGMGTYVGIEDMARAYRLALENPRPGCEAYHFSADDVITRQPIRQRLLQYHPDHPPLPEDWPAWRSPLVTDKAREHFGWHATFSIRDAYRQVRGHDPPAWRG